jgi:hypothetical protein
VRRSRPGRSVSFCAYEHQSAVLSAAARRDQSQEQADAAIDLAVAPGDPLDQSRMGPYPQPTWRVGPEMAPSVTDWAHTHF